MAPRSPLYVASNVVLRLVKEEEYYHKELEGQKKKIAKMEAGGASGDDENAEFVLKQEVSRRLGLSTSSSAPTNFPPPPCSSQWNYPLLPPSGRNEEMQRANQRRRPLFPPSRCFG